MGYQEICQVNLTFAGDIELTIEAKKSRRSSKIEIHSMEAPSFFFVPLQLL